MGLFKINTSELHLSIAVQFSDGQKASYGFCPLENDIPTNYDVAMSYIMPSFGFTGLFSLIGITGLASLFLAYKNPTTGVLMSAIYIQQMKGFLKSSDGLGGLEQKTLEDSDTFDANSRELDNEAEERLIKFLEDKNEAPPTYDIYNYNCASFVKEAFCVVSPEECGSFKDVVLNQVYDSPTFLNIISVSFLNIFGMLD